MLTRDKLTAFIQGLNVAGARPRLPMIYKYVRQQSPQDSEKILSDLKSYPDFVSHTKLDSIKILLNSKPLAKPAAKKKKKRG